MATQTDPNQVRLTGENQYMRLHKAEGGPMTTRCGHWRVLFSPAGPGHVMFLRSDVTDNQVRIYADSQALARWLQQEIVTSGEFSDQTIDITAARFSRMGDTQSFWTETVETASEHIMLTWRDFGEPFVIIVPVGSDPNRPLGWSSVFVPARSAQLSLNGNVAVGRPFPEPRAERLSSTAGLALSETWLRPS
jgi:hypothetical protein